MKQSWSLYRHVRGWSVLLALGLTLGALGGLAYDYIRADFSEVYMATANIHLRRPMDPGTIPHIHFEIISDLTQTTEKAATENVISKVDQLIAYTNGPIKYDIVIERSTSGAPGQWWKTVIVGSVIGTLLVIGGIYVWEDVRAYQQDHQ